jgi:hypothetical protein
LEWKRLRLFDAKTVTGPGNQSGWNLQSERAHHQGDLADLITFGDEANTIPILSHRQATVVRDAQTFGTFFQQEFDIVEIECCVTADAGVAHERSHLVDLERVALLGLWKGSSSLEASSMKVSVPSYRSS